MPVTGATYPTNVDTSGAGTSPWTATGNLAADDNSEASCNLAAAGGQSDVLNPNTFDFAIPATATILGIMVEIDSRYNIDDDSSNPRDHTVQLTKSSGAVGTNKALSTTPFGSAPNTVTYGGSTDTWGTTWTATEINDATFGVHYIAQRDAGVDPVNIRLDFIRITVWYRDGDDGIGGTPFGQRSQVCVTGT